MRARFSYLPWLCLALLGCTETIEGERSRSACLGGGGGGGAPGNGTDEDRDGTVDCNDPDCFAFPECRPFASAPEASKSAAIPGPGRYRLRLGSLTVSEADKHNGCFDTDCPPVAGSCTCLPDPYVGVFVVAADGEDRLIGNTEATNDTLEVSFERGSFSVELASGERLVLRGFDLDDPDDDDPMFECQATRRSVDSATLLCIVPPSSALDETQFTISARVAVE